MSPVLVRGRRYRSCSASACLALCESHGLRLYASQVRDSQALLAATRGEDRLARDLTHEMVRWALRRRADLIVDSARHARGLAHSAGVTSMRRISRRRQISPPGVFAECRRNALWSCMDLVEAAMHAGRQAEAAAHIAAVQGAGIGALSPRLDLLAHGSAAMAATDHSEAVELFERAVRIPGRLAPA